MIDLDGNSPAIHIVAMNTNPTNNPPPSPVKQRATGSYIATAAMFLILVFVWRDQSRMKDDILVLVEQNDQLQQELTVAQSKLEEVQGGDFSKSTEQTTPATRPEPVEEPETMALQTPSVSETASGLVARLVLEPTTQETPDLVALVVRIPNSSNAQILNFSPTKETAYSNVRARVDESGKFAIFQGTPTGLKTLEFNLSVSAPVTATVRGSKGIKPFEIDIKAGTPNVRQL